jgi:hypothetical protein
MRPGYVLWFALCSVLFDAGLISAQQTPRDSAPPARYDAGVFANDTYTNECLGFSFPMPSGWLAKSQGISGIAKAIHLPGGGLNLLMIEHPKQGAFGNTITLYASPASEALGSAKDFVTRAVQTQVTRNPQNNQILRETFAVDYAGKHFFRADYKAAQPRASVRSFVFTRFRNYYLGEMIEAASPAELDSAADSLKRISFREDVPDPKCSTGEEARAGSRSHAPN